MFGIAGLTLNSLLSLPVISYFLFPTTTTGWSTYLNVIFFSLAWTTLIWTQPPLAVEFFSVFGVRLFCYILPSLFFLSFDLAVPALAKGLKARDGALPFEAAGKPSGVKTQQVRLLRIVGLALFNVLLAAGLQTGIDFVFTDVFRLRSVLRITSRLPAPWSLLTDIIKAALIRGTLSYYIHRFLLHSPKYSPILSRAHMAYAHSLDNALPFAAAYDHPAAYLLHRWLPTYLPALAFRFHILTYMFFNALVCLEEAFVFSGYQVLPSTVLWTGMARRQERHIISGGTGNFAPYGLADFIHGTTIGDEDITDDLRQEADKRNVRGKARGAAHAARDAVDSRDNELDGDASGNGGRRGKKSKN